MGCAIVVLAAGLGRRFGGLKQLAALGPAGEAVLDYTLRDAASAGFSHAVIVVARETVDAMNDHFANFAPPIPVELRVQPNVMPGRAAPLGTAHATLVGATGIHTPFAVANADDAYGVEAIATIAEFLRSLAEGPTRATAAVVGYRAAATLSVNGGVSRAVCVVDEQHQLLGIEEHTGVRRTVDGIVSDTAQLDDSTLVSMNLWGFDPSFLDLLRPAVEAFIAETPDGDHELRLPDLVGTLVAHGELTAAVLPTASQWFGVTFPHDAPAVRTHFAALDAAAYFATDRPLACTPVVHGHIHDTFFVTCPAEKRFVLQRLNHEIFRDLDGLAENFARITAHVARKAVARGVGSIVTEPIATRSGSWMHIDATGAAWRAMKYVESSRALGADSTVAELRAAARAFAALTRDLDDVGPLVDTIPRFHDLPRRLAELDTAVAADRVGRAAGVRDLVATARTRAARLTRELDALDVDRLPRRVVHNDAKLDNVLVDSETGAVAAIVDLDTVMYGTVLNDFGELARTAAAGAAEDEPDLAKVVLDRERFAALATGYLDGARDFLLDSEREALALAGPLLTLENAVRFLTDHLNGDVYFRVHRDAHNAQRARTQLHLAAQMLDRLDELRAVVVAAVPS